MTLRRACALALLSVLAALGVQPLGPPAEAADDCVPTSTSWSEAPVRFQPTTADQTRCLSFDAAPGDRVWAQVPPEYGTVRTAVVVDSTGEEACVADGGEAGCVLTGTPPYRYVTTGTGTEYPAAVRDVTGLSGCPALDATAYGSPLDDAAPGWCRELRPTAAAPYVVGTSAGTEAAVYSTDGHRVSCGDLLSVCPLEAGKRYFVTRGPATWTLRATLHRFAGPGCGTRVDAAISGQAVGTVRRGEVDCVRLSHPAGAQVGVASPAAAPGAEVLVHDADGRQVCDTFAGARYLCDLRGPAPFRALVVDDHRSRYRLAFPRYDDPQGCRELRTGPWGTTRGTTVRVPRGRVAACVTAPTRQLTGLTWVGVRRTAGSADGYVTARVGTEAACLVPVRERTVTETCRAGSAAWQQGVVVVEAGPGGSRWKLVTRNAGSGRGCEPARSTRVGGRATTGELRSPLQFDCVRHPADPGDVLLQHVGGQGLRTVVTSRSGEGLCWLWDEPCQVGGESGYRVILSEDRARAGSVPYSVEPWTVRTGDRWTDGCRAVAGDDGFARFRATLGPRHTSDCVTVEGDALPYGYDVRVTDDSASLSVLPYVVERVPDLTGEGPCSYRGDDVYACDGWVGPVDDTAPAMLVLHRSRARGSVTYRASGSPTG